LPQNFLLGGFFVLHLGHSVSFDWSSLPQLPQDFMLEGISAPHFEHFILFWGPSLVPQFPQNFVPRGF
jgi:hypothetical protein